MCKCSFCRENLSSHAIIISAICEVVACLRSWIPKELTNSNFDACVFFLLFERKIDLDGKFYETCQKRKQEF